MHDGHDLLPSWIAFPQFLQRIFELVLEEENDKSLFITKLFPQLSQLKCKSFFETKAPCQLQEVKTEMGENMDKQHIEELKEMIRDKKTAEPVEKVLVKFCARHGVSLDTCRIYYDRLVEKGEIEEK